MSYQILGALRVLADDVAAENDTASQAGQHTAATEVSLVGARKVQTLLATLLTRANQVVSSDQLLLELWGQSPPRRAMAGLHVYVSQLRKFLATVIPDREPLITRSPGYLIQVGSDELDLLVFRRLIHKGRSRMRSGRPDEASAAFAAALSLWRGPVLDDLRDGEIVSRFVARVEEVRLECTEMLVECDFTLGRHRELVGMLYDLVSEHPLHEAFYRQLMLALYHCERRADALRVYQVARETMTTELGLEPCRPLRELHHAILLGDEVRSA